MKNKLSVLALAFSCISIVSAAQTTIMEKDVLSDTIAPRSGPNLRHFTHLYLGFGFVGGQVEGGGASIRYFHSTDFNAGIRHKRKINRFYDLVFDFNYGLTSFSIEQQAGKTFPTTNLFSREKINFNHFGLQLYNRINFGRRGNFIKNFIDLGGYGDWEFQVKHITVQNNISSSPYFANNARVIHTGLDYINNLNYGLGARIGRNRFSLYGKYRLSNLFKPDYNFPELPRLIVGLQMGLHW
jgi:hypothetical protein